MDATLKQDLPPEGGYRKINYNRNPAKSYFRGGRLLAGFALLNGATMYYYFGHCRPKINHQEVEKNGAHLATLPLMLAEKDRAYLNALRKNREEEEKLMANVPGWEVGKLYNEPIFKTAGEDELMFPQPEEFMVHTSIKDMSALQQERLWAK